jgi:hypothetical protein
MALLAALRINQGGMRAGQEHLKKERTSERRNDGYV